MKVTRRLKITVTQRRTLRACVATVQAFCPVCARTVETFASAQAAAILELDEQQFADLAATGLVHTLQTVNGKLRVCRDSLFARDTGELL